MGWQPSDLRNNSPSRAHGRAYAGLNGVEATRQIKTLVPRSTIIGLTAQQEAGTELAMLSAGAERLAKEDMVEGLPPVIERAISQRVSGRCKPTR